MKPTNPKNAKTLYVIFSVIVVGLIFLIVWFIYLLKRPTDDTNTVTNANTVTVNTNAKITDDTENTNKKPNQNNNANANVNADVEDEGLVEPDEDSTDEDETDEEDTDSEEEAKEEDETTGESHTLYFASSSSSCGEVVAVEREFELGDDPYGEIILTMMAGPEADESGADGIPSTVRLRRVEYTAEGPLVTVSEGYDELDDCAQQTVDKQFIETANAMFDLPEGTSGEVVVGTVEAEETEAEEESQETE